MDQLSAILPDYNLYQLHNVQPEHTGHCAVARQRTYIYCCHRQTCSYLTDVYDMYNRITKTLMAHIVTEPKHYFAENNLQRDLLSLDMCRKRSIPYQPEARLGSEAANFVFKLCVASLVCVFLLLCQVLFIRSVLTDSLRPDIKGRNDVTYFLNSRELTLVRQLDAEYMSRFKAPPEIDENIVYFLGDRFEWSKTWSVTSGKTPTFRRNKGLYIQRSSMRAMTPADKLAALGWPTSLETAGSMGVSRVPILDVQRGDLMAGNAMHLSNSAVVLLIGLSCFGRSQH